MCVGSNDELTAIEIAISALRSEDQKPSYESIQCNRERTEPPNDGIPDEVNLTMILDPKVLNAAS